MNTRQKRLYRDLCDVYKPGDSLSVPSYKNVACLLERKGFHRYGNAFSEINLNEDYWYFPIDQSIKENWVICLTTQNHPEKGERWLVRGTPVGQTGKVNRWKVRSERHFVVPNPFI